MSVMNIMKLFIFFFMLMFSISLCFTEKYDLVTTEEYIDGRNEISRIYYNTDEYESKMDSYDSRFTSFSNGKYIEETSNVKEGLFFVFGTILIGLVIIDGIIKDNKNHISNVWITMNNKLCKESLS